MTEVDVVGFLVPCTRTPTRHSLLSPLPPRKRNLPEILTCRFCGLVLVPLCVPDSQHSCIAQPKCLEFFNEATEPLSPGFLGFLLGWLLTFVCQNMHFSPNFAPRLCSVMLTNGEDGKNYMTGSYSFHQGNLCTVLWLVASGRFSFRSMFILPFCVCGLGAGEDDRVTFPRLLQSWRKLQSISHGTLSFCFPLLAFSLSPFNADILPFTSLSQHSYFNSFILASKFRALFFRSICLFTTVFICLRI